jgi:hypothetical protein
MKPYIALCTITRGRVKVRAGAELSLSDESAQALMNRDFPAVRPKADPAEDATPREPAKGPAKAAGTEKEPPARRNAADTIALAKTLDDTVELLRIRDAEERHEAPRTTVLAAIDNRLEQLAAGNDADEEDPTGSGDQD